MCALRQYRFLTANQMQRLGLSRSLNVLRDKTLFALRQGDFVQSEKIGSTLPHVHALTQRGVDILNELDGYPPQAAPHPKRQAFSLLFAPHRIAQIDFQIGLNQWVEARGDMEIVLEQQDFTRQPRPATELLLPEPESDIPRRSVIPDGLFAITNHKNQSALYVLEVHRTSQSKAVAAQLSQYFAVIEQQLMKTAFNFDAHPIICSLHQHPSVLKSVKTRLLADARWASFRHNFVFHLLDDISTNFTGGWHFSDDTPANPFPALNPPSDVET